MSGMTLTFDLSITSASCFVPFDIAGETNISFQLKFITKIEYHIVGLNFTTIFVAIDVSK